MRLSTLALLTLLTLSLRARATPLIDDLLIVGDSHTIAFSLPSILPPGTGLGADEVQYYTDSFGMIDGVGSLLTIDFSVFLDGYRRLLPASDIDISAPGGLDYSLGGPLIISAGLFGSNAYLVSGNYTFDQTAPFGSTNSFAVSVTPETAPSPVPEPGTLGLLLAGLPALSLALRCQKARLFGSLAS